MRLIPVTWMARTVKLRYTIDGWLYRQDPGTRELLDRYRREWAGRPALVVGNGPSLNRTPLEDFVGVPSIGMNKINMLFSRTSWRPSLITCVNNLVVRQNRDYFLGSDIPIFLSWKCRWFLGRGSGRNVHYLLGRPTLEFSTDAGSWVAGLGATVTYFALQLAYHLGANPVILFGVDHSFKVATDKQAILKSDGPDVNHFDPNYFGKGMYWGTPDLEASEVAYRLAKRGFEADGREVLDATIDGKLRVFRRIDLDEAKAICRR